MDLHKIFQKLYKNYINNTPVNISNHSIKTIVRYYPAIVFVEFKLLYNNLYNQIKFNRIQKILEKNHKTIKKYFII